MNHNEKPIKDISYVSKINKIKILNLIREEGVISRSEIAKKIGLSLPTVSRLVDSLVQKEKLILEVGTRTTERGRPPNLVTFAGNQNFVVGVSIGRMHITGVLTNLNAEIRAEHRIPTDAQKGFASVVRRCADGIKELIRLADVSDENVLGVGVALGGLIDTRKSQVAYSATLNWKNKDFAGAVSEIVNKPVKLDHDARVMALGELAFGTGDRFQNCICVLLGYGIGASFVVDGKLFYGKCGMTGELGHIEAAGNQKIQCSCGNYGCLDTIASGRAIALQAQAEIAKSKSTLLHQLCKGDPSNISAETVASAAQQGDKLSRRILLDAADHIGIGLSSLVNLFNPEAIILGGSLVQAGDFLFERIRSVIEKRTLQQISNGIVIEPSKLGNRSRIMGAVALILDEVLNLNISIHSHYPDGL